VKKKVKWPIVQLFVRETEVELEAQVECFVEGRETQRS
jgi:hypothetical protein